VGAAIEWAIRSTKTELVSRARVVTDLSATCSVKLDETRLGQILFNLMLNACRHAWQRMPMLRAAR
jgi:signal transduction histidine kinase